MELAESLESALHKVLVVYVISGNVYVYWGLHQDGVDCWFVLPILVLYNCGLVFQQFPDIFAPIKTVCVFCFWIDMKPRYFISSFVCPGSDCISVVYCLFWLVIPSCMSLCVLQQVYENVVSDDASLKKLIKQLLAIISRPARLLEVLVSTGFSTHSH